MTDSNYECLTPLDNRKIRYLRDKVGRRNQCIETFNGLTQKALRAVQRAAPERVELLLDEMALEYQRHINSETI